MTNKTVETKVVEDKKVDEQTRMMEQTRADEQEFFDFLSGKKAIHEVQTRAISNSTHGMLIPTTISKSIVEEIITLSPAIANCRHFDMTGRLEFVVEDVTVGKVTAQYVEEGQAVTPTDAKFKVVSIFGYTIMAETILSKSTLLNSQFDIRDYVIKSIAKSFTSLLEEELFEGKTKIQGVATIPDTRKVKLVAGTTLTSDHIIDAECLIPTAVRSNAAWYMNPEMLKDVRKLKDGNGQYILQRDFANPSAMTISGRPVYQSDFIPSSKIYFCDLSGMYMKVAQSLSTMVLQEKYAEYGQIAVLGSAECDAKPVELAKLACLEIAQA